jgi:hypothetical protein
VGNHVAFLISTNPKNPKKHNKQYISLDNTAHLVPED